MWRWFVGRWHPDDGVDTDQPNDNNNTDYADNTNDADADDANDYRDHYHRRGWPRKSNLRDHRRGRAGHDGQ